MVPEENEGEEWAACLGYGFSRLEQRPSRSECAASAARDASAARIGRPRAAKGARAGRAGVRGGAGAPHRGPSAAAAPSDGQVSSRELFLAELLQSDQSGRRMAVCGVGGVSSWLLSRRLWSLRE